MSPLQRLLADIFCWVGLTATLVYYDYPTIAGFIGSFGLIYLYHSFMSYWRIRRIVIIANKALNELDVLEDEWHKKQFGKERRKK